MPTLFGSKITFDITLFDVTKLEFFLFSNTGWSTIGRSWIITLPCTKTSSSTTRTRAITPCSPSTPAFIDCGVYLKHILQLYSSFIDLQMINSEMYLTSWSGVVAKAIFRCASFRHGLTVTIDTPSTIATFSAIHRRTFLSFANVGAIDMTAPQMSTWITQLQHK